MDIFCECGCGELVRKPGNRFMRGHHLRTEKYKKIMFIANKGNKYSLGHEQSEERKRQSSERMKGNKYRLGHVPSKETRHRLSIAGMGNKRSLGYKHTEETKRKRSEALKGNKHTLGYKHTDETKRKIGEASKGNQNSLGRRYKHTEVTRKKISLAHGGDGTLKLILYSYPAEFSGELKAQIRARDGNKCQNPGCWGKAKRISVHHIDYNKENCSPDNLITLCNSCNARANYDKEYWIMIYSLVPPRKIHAKSRFS